MPGNKSERSEIMLIGKYKFDYNFYSLLVIKELTQVYYVEGAQDPYTKYRPGKISEKDIVY